MVAQCDVGAEVRLRVDRDALADGRCRRNRRVRVDRGEEARSEPPEQHGDRVMLVGDVQQLGSVEAGRAFSSLQEHGMSTYKLDEIVRQNDPNLKESVEDTIRREAGNALEKIESSGEVQEAETATERRQMIADDYARLSPEQRAGTVVIDPARDGRNELNDMIRDKLKDQGELSREEAGITAREKKDMTKTEAKSVRSYEQGDKLEFGRDYKQAGIQKGETYTVRSADEQTGKAEIEDSQGNVTAFRPDRTDPTKVQAYREQEIGLSQGDKVTFSENDRSMGVQNGTRGEVTEIGQDQITVQTSSGQEVTLDKNEAYGVRHGYAETAHAAQGRTADRAMVHAESQRQNLVNQRSMYVGISRAKEEARIYTDNAEKLKDALKERTGEKSSALDRARDEKAEKEKSQGQGQEKTSAIQRARDEKAEKEKGQEKDMGAQKGQDRSQGREEQAQKHTEAHSAKNEAQKDQGQGREEAQAEKSQEKGQSEQQEKQEDRTQDQGREQDQDRAKDHSQGREEQAQEQDRGIDREEGAEKDTEAHSAKNEAEQDQGKEQGQEQDRAEGREEAAIAATAAHSAESEAEAEQDHGQEQEQEQEQEREEMSAIDRALAEKAEKEQQQEQEQDQGQEKDRGAESELREEVAENAAEHSAEADPFDVEEEETAGLDISQEMDNILEFGEEAEEAFENFEQELGESVDFEQEDEHGIDGPEMD